MIFFIAQLFRKIVIFKQNEKKNNIQNYLRIHLLNPLYSKSNNTFLNTIHNIF